MTEVEPKISHRLFADLALLVVNVIWGATFIMVDKAVEAVSVFIFIALRFTIGFFTLLLVFGYQLWKLKINWGVIWRGMIIGFCLFAGYSFQTFGLQVGTEPGKAAFITGLSVVLVPIFASFILKKTPHPVSWLSIVIAVIGLGMLTLENGFNFQIGNLKGDLLVLACAVSFAFHIITIDRFVSNHHFIPLSITQTGITAVLSWAAALIFWNSSFPIQVNKQVIFALAFTGIIATALIIAVQTFAQKKTSPIHVAVIFSTEPVFAAIFALIFTSETFLWRQWGGCFLILIGMIFQQLIDIYFKKRAAKEKTSSVSEKDEEKNILMG